MNKMMIFWLAVLLLFLGSFITWYTIKNAHHGDPAVGQEPTDYGPPLEHFQLTQSTGKAFDSTQLHGQIWVANFFYASCPSICLRENFAIQEIEQQFGHRGVKFVSITVDPANDTVSRLDEYSQRFNADPSRWFFLTGDLKYITRVGEDIFKTQIEPGGHTERLFVVDRSGEIRGAFHFQNPVEMQEMRALLNELLLEEPAVEDAAPAESDGPSATEPAA